MPKSKQPFELELPKKSTKTRKSYYIPEDIIKYIKDESKRLGTSENDFLTAIVHFYQKTLTIDGDGGAAYDVVKKSSD